MSINSRNLIATITLYLALILSFGFPCRLAAATHNYEYRLVFATNTSQLEKDINQAASQGFRVAFMKEAETSSGGQILVLMVKDKGLDSTSSYKYAILASGRASLLEKRMNESALDGFQYRAMAESAYKLILIEKGAVPAAVNEYRVLTAVRLESLRKHIDAAAEQGFRIEDTDEVGFGYTAILSRPKGLDKARYIYDLVNAVPKSTDNGFALRGLLGSVKTVYVMEKDLNNAPEKTQYRIQSLNGNLDPQAMLRLAQQDGFCLMNASFPSGPLGGVPVVAMKKMNGKCDHIYVEDLQYYEDAQYYQAKEFGKGVTVLPFLDQLNKWGSQGYEVVGFGPLKAVMIMPQS